MVLVDVFYVVLARVFAKITFSCSTVESEGSMLWELPWMPGLIISTLAQDHNAFEKKSSCTQTRANADSSGTKAIKTSGQEGPNTKVSLHQIKVTPPVYRVLPSNDHCVPCLQTRWLPHRLWVRQWIKKEPAPGLFSQNCEHTLVTMRNKLYIDTDCRSQPCPPDETNPSLQRQFNASLDAKREERK